MRKKTPNAALEIMGREFFLANGNSLRNLNRCVPTTLLRERFSNCARGRSFRSVNWRSWRELPRRSSADSKIPIASGTHSRCSIVSQPTAQSVEGGRLRGGHNSDSERKRKVNRMILHC